MGMIGLVSGETLTVGGGGSGQGAAEVTWHGKHRHAGPLPIPDLFMHRARRKGGCVFH